MNSAHLSRDMNGDILLIVDGETHSVVATFGSPLWYAIVGKVVRDWISAAIVSVERELQASTDEDRAFTETTLAGCAETQRRLDALEERRKAAAEKFGLDDDGAQEMEILRELVTLDDWVVQAGGMEGPLPQDVIQKFAELRLSLMDRARAIVGAPLNSTRNEGEK